MTMDALRQHAAKRAAKDKGVDRQLGDTEKSLGDSMAQRGEYTEAIDWYSKALEKNPENEAYWTARSAALLKINCAREALLDARTAVQLSPTWHEGYHHLGLAFQEMGMMGYAETAFKNAKRMCPAFEDADKALAALKKTFGERHTQQRKQAGAELSLCQSVYAGDYEGVKEHLTSGKAISPEFVTLPHRELFMTPMQVALLNQYFDIAQVLLDNDILFPENVCDWMIAQAMAERRARQEAEADAAAAKREAAALHADLLAARGDAAGLKGENTATATKLQRVQEQLELLASRLSAAQQDTDAARVARSRMERQMQEADRLRNQHDAAVRATESALKRMTAERDGLARELAELKARAGLQTEERLQSVAWKVQYNSNTDEVEITEVSPLVDPGAAETDLTRCMQHCVRSHDTFQQALAQMMKARQAETAARTGLKEALGQAEARGAWTLPLTVVIDQWYTLKVDLEREEQRCANFSVGDVKAVLGHLAKLERDASWKAFADLLGELHTAADRILEALVAGRVDDTGYAAVLQGVVDDLDRAARDEPLATCLIDLAEQEGVVKKALPLLKERLARVQDPGPRMVEARRQLELTDALLELIGRKITALNGDPSGELAKLSALVTRSSDTIAKVRRTWSLLADLVDTDLQGLRKGLVDHKETEFNTEARDKQKAFSGTVADNDRKQEDLWTAIIGNLAQLGQLQDERAAAVQRRLVEIWTVKRKHKVHQLMLDLTTEKLGRLEVLERRCIRADEVAGQLTQFVLTYNSRMTKFVRDAHSKLQDGALPVHKQFHQWFMTWVEDYLALLQLKRQSLEKANQLALRARLGQRVESAPPTEGERQTLEREVADLEATLRAKVAQFDAPGRTGEYLLKAGVAFSHPILLVYPPKKPDPPAFPEFAAAATPYPGLLGLPSTTTYVYPPPTPAAPSFSFQDHYGAFPGMPMAATSFPNGDALSRSQAQPTAPLSYAPGNFAAPQYNAPQFPNPPPAPQPFPTTYQYYQSLPNGSLIPAQPGYTWH